MIFKIEHVSDFLVFKCMIFKYYISPGILDTSNLLTYAFIHYSYVPSEDEPIVIYEKPGVSIDVSKKPLSLLN